MNVCSGLPSSCLRALLLAAVLPSIAITLKQDFWRYDEGFRDDPDFVPYHSVAKRGVNSEPENPPSRAASAPPSTPKTVTEGFLEEETLRDLLENDVIVPQEKINETIDEALMHSDSLNGTQMDNHRYYRAEFLDNRRLWVNLDAVDSSMVNDHKMLSKSYRRAATIPLTFNFPFYGHNVTNVTIATGGFLYTGDYVHAWLPATQYIAPLMANFDTSQNDNAKIRYLDNGTALIVEWKNVCLKGRDSESKQLDAKPFSFQVILHSTGDIVFAYKAIPVAITVIGDKDHPVKVGLSDAYIIDRTIFFVRRKTIYEYHRIDLKEHKITNSSAIYFRALATCNGEVDCRSCVDTKVDDPSLSRQGEDLDCMWCPSLNRCSDGMDRLRQEWLMNSCDTFHRKKGGKECDAVFSDAKFGGGGDSGRKKPGSFPSVVNGDGTDSNGPMDYNTFDGIAKKKLPANASHYQAGIIAISVVVVLVVSLMAWFVYAYFFPHSWSGQLLIKYRPSHWQWRRAEPRYTAASIHM